MIPDLRSSSKPPLIMGILNLTPDSFSDGGRHLDTAAAVSHALDMLEDGADIIDVGGESTRPGSRPIPAEEQKRRVLTVIKALRDRVPAQVPISIDTTLAEVAEAVLDAGGNWINDVSAGLDDARMLSLSAERGAPIVLMHRRGRSDHMQDDPRYRDVVAEVRDHLAGRVDAALAVGVSETHILLDPGIGFGKTLEHNLALIGGLDRLVDLGFPVLLGTSRKRFLGSICGGLEPTALMPATCATTTLGVMAGARVFRVHDVAGNRQAADVAWSVRGSARGAELSLES
ncbi:dihydropteroate synthase [Imhoffiella purpurea]|uniref:Dihydropteroate synthase n=1 Tax=Imhoffiella purpurea TaxID=1249627 RepID=W9VVF7_9GAMM|nr:dihydropteroate synthase [Imhoffiella purpurea]EXJ14380.1 Dihydropteroate synthase [Imhoffiella purpurea]